MEQWGPDEVMNLIKQLEPIRDQAAQDKDSVIAMYSGFDPRKDARVTAFSKMINQNLPINIIWSCRFLVGTKLDN